LIGERVYSGDLNTPADQIYAQRVPPLASKCPSLPSEFQGVFDKALALDPNQRFQDAETFADGLREVAHGHGLLYSAPQLAAELRELLGPNPDHWLRDEGDPQRAATDRPANGASDLEGQEASSVASDSADDVETPTMVERLRPRAARQVAGDPAGEPNPAASKRAAPSLAAAGSLVGGAAALDAGGGRNGSTRPRLAIVPKAISLPVPANPPLRGGVAAIRRSRRNLWITLALATLVLLAGGVVLFRGGVPRQPASTAKGTLPDAGLLRPAGQR